MQSADRPSSVRRVAHLDRSLEVTSEVACAVHAPRECTDQPSDGPRLASVVSPAWREAAVRRNASGIGFVIQRVFGGPPTATKSMGKRAPPIRLERTTFGLGNRCSIH